MKPIRTERLILRNWEERDRDLFHLINSDERVMEFFPFRRDRAQADAKMDEFRADIRKNGHGWTAAEVASTGHCIGFVGIAHSGILPGFPNGTIEIGWRLAPEFWGHGYVTEAAKAWLEFGFQRLHLPEIISMAIPGNHRSISVMQRIGMKADPANDFDHPNIPDSQEHLKRHVLYRLSREDWNMQKMAAG